MCLILDQFLWGHSSRVCDISCFSVKDFSATTWVRILEFGTKLDSDDSVGRCVIPWEFLGESVKHTFSCREMYSV